MSDDSLERRNHVAREQGPLGTSIRRPRSREVRRFARWSGVIGGLIGFAAVLLAAVLSPTFSWFTHEISDLGASAARTPWLLNTGLVISGLVALPFAGVLYRAAVHPLQRSGAVTFGVTLCTLSALGLFPVGTTPHLGLSVTFFSLGTVTLVVHGTGTVLGARDRDGLVSLWLGIIHMVLWLVWSAGLGVGSGLAIPELVGTLLFFTWILRRTVLVSQ